MGTNKKQTTSNIVFDDKRIILRSVFEKAGIKYFIQPCKDKYGHWPSCIKRVNSDGDMIMSEAERDAFSSGSIALFPENHIFEVVSGKVYDLNDIWQAAEWEAIKNCPLIAKSRDERNADGTLKIDGETWVPSKITKSGVAELYIDRPGIETQRRISKKQLVHKACAYIYNDERGAEGQITMAKLLGKNMKNQPLADVTDYLISVAEKDPEKIISLYTGDNTSLRLMFIDALEKKVIYIKDKLYLYADNIALGATDDAVIAWMRDPKNLKVLELIKKDTYPDMGLD